MSKSKVQKGSIGFVYGGNVLKVGVVCLFVSDEQKPEMKFDKLKKGNSDDEVKLSVGPYVSCRYVPCEKQNEMFTALKSKLAEHHIAQDLYAVYSTTVINIMKEITGSKTVNKLSAEKKEDHEANSESEVDKKSKKKPSKKETKQEETEEDKPVEKKPVKKAPVKKETKPAETTEDEKPQKKPQPKKEEKKPQPKKVEEKKPVKKMEKSDSDSESKSDDSDDSD